MTQPACIHCGKPTSGTCQVCYQPGCGDCGGDADQQRISRCQWHHQRMVDKSWHSHMAVSASCLDKRLRQKCYSKGYSVAHLLGVTL